MDVLSAERDLSAGGRLHVRVGCEFELTSDAPTPAVVMVQPKLESGLAIVEEHWNVRPVTPFREAVDAIGNGVRRLVLPVGDFLLRYDAIVTMSSDVDATEPAAQQIDPHELSGESLIYLLPSRFCQSDALLDKAWQMSAASSPVGRAFRQSAIGCTKTFVLNTAAARRRRVQRKRSSGASACAGTSRNSPLRFAVL